MFIFTLVSIDTVSKSRKFTVCAFTPRGTGKIAWTTKPVPEKGIQSGTLLLSQGLVMAVSKEIPLARNLIQLARCQSKSSTIAFLQWLMLVVMVTRMLCSQLPGKEEGVLRTCNSTSAFFFPLFYIYYKLLP